MREDRSELEIEIQSYHDCRVFIRKSFVGSETVLKGTIRGINQIFTTDIEAPMVILVTGPPGSMKTSFVHQVMTLYLEKSGEFGLYATLEQDVKSHLRNMESVGIDISLNMQISDYTDLRRGGNGSLDYLEFTHDMVKHFKELKKDKFTVFGFDSLGALYSLMKKDKDNMRQEMFHFFSSLRDFNLISFVVMERSIGGESNLLGNEGFLSDGIVYLGLKRKQGRLRRYIQIEKMRACRHSMEMYAMDVHDDGLVILGPIFED